MENGHPDFEVLSLLDLIWLGCQCCATNCQSSAHLTARATCADSIFAISPRASAVEDNIERLVHDELLDDEQFSHTHYARLLRVDCATV